MLHPVCRPRLLFSDEFNGAALDRTKWEPQIGSGCQYNLNGWGNAERCVAGAAGHNQDCYMNEGEPQHICCSRGTSPALLRHFWVPAWCATAGPRQSEPSTRLPPSHCRQWYTDLPANLAVRRGSLVLQAVRSADPGLPYTSARVRTFGKFGVAPSAAYPLIRIQARIKVPQGLGLWSAFW